MPRRSVIVKTKKVGASSLEEKQNMLNVRRITIITPEFSQPLLN